MFYGCLCFQESITCLYFTLEYFIAEIGGTHYSLVKQAQNHFYMLSNPSLVNDVIPLTGAFQSLVDRLVTHLERNSSTADHIIEAIPMLPSIMKSKYKSILEGVMLKKASSIFSNIHNYSATFTLLRVTLNEVQDEQLKRDTDQYICHLEQLQGKVPLHHILDMWDNRNFNSLPLSHTLMSMELQQDMISFTLGNLKKLGVDFASEFSRELSGPSSLVLHEVATRERIIVSWGIPRTEAARLYRELLKDSNREMFERNGVVQVSLHNQRVFDICKFLIHPLFT